MWNLKLDLRFRLDNKYVDIENVIPPIQADCSRPIYVRVDVYCI